MSQFQQTHKQILENLFTDNLTIQQHLDNLHDFMFYWNNQDNDWSPDYTEGMLKTYEELRYLLKSCREYETLNPNSSLNKKNKAINKTNIQSQQTHKQILKDLFTDDITIQQHLSNLHDFMFYWISQNNEWVVDYKDSMLKTYSELRYLLKSCIKDEVLNPHSIMNRNLN